MIQKEALDIFARLQFDMNWERIKGELRGLVTVFGYRHEADMAMNDMVEAFIEDFTARWDQ